MTNQTIQSIIDQFNGKKRNYYIYSHLISGNVVFAMVWLDKDYHTLIDASPYYFYFILNSKSKAIGAVLDMNQDLHGYILPKSRKKGFLTNAFTQHIFPHLSQTRKVQRLTIDKTAIGEVNYSASLSSALRSGFQITGQEEGKTILQLKLFKFKNIRLSPSLMGMSFDRMTELRKDLNANIAGIYRIWAEIEIKLGDSQESRQLKRIVDILQKYRIYKLEDTLFEYLEKGGKPIE